MEPRAAREVFFNYAEITYKFNEKSYHALLKNAREKSRTCWIANPAQIESHATWRYTGDTDYCTWACYWLSVQR